MAVQLDLLLVFACVVLSEATFYKPIHIPGMVTVTPRTKAELIQALSGSEPKKVIIDRVFDFNTAMVTEPACAWTKSEELCEGGQLVLKKFGKCLPDEEIVYTTYSKEGFKGLFVGWNKYIVGRNGGGLKGKGLFLDGSEDVEIRNLAITDINPNIYLGGTAIEMRGAVNVLIESNYFRNIGNAMIYTSRGSSTGVTISNNVFDGETPYSYHCDGTHSTLWLFAGTTDEIKLQDNTVLHVSGWAPMVAATHAGSIIYLYQNLFHDLRNEGAITVDKRSNVLVEGNTYWDVSKLMDEESMGHVYFVTSEAEELACGLVRDKRCKTNNLVNVANSYYKNSAQVLRTVKDMKDRARTFHDFFKAKAAKNNK